MSEHEIGSRDLLGSSSCSSRLLETKFLNYRVWFAAVTLLAIFLFLLQASFIVNYRQIIPKHDPTYYYSYVRSAVIDEDLNLKDEYKHFKINNYAVSPVGLPVNTYTIGFPLLVLPFYAITHGVITGLDDLGFKIRARGYGIPYQIAFCIGSIIYAFIGLNLCFSFLKNHFTEFISFISVIVVIFTTNLFYYIAAEPFMSHACSFFSVALFLYLWDKSTSGGNLSYCFWLGVAAGLMISVRQQNAAFVAVPLIGYFWNRGSVRVPDVLKTVTLAVSGLGLGLLPQFLAWKEMFGSWLVYSYGQQSFIYKFDPKVLQVLFSSRHGLLSWHPILIVCLMGLLFSKRKFPRIGVLFIIGFLLQLYINSSWWCWWLGNSFGNRGFVSCSLVFSFGLAYILSRGVVKINSWRFIASSAILGLWNLLLAVSYLTKMITQTKPLVWSDLFLNIWRLPMFVIYRMNHF